MLCKTRRVAKVRVARGAMQPETTGCGTKLQSALTVLLTVLPLLMNVVVADTVAAQEADAANDAEAEPLKPIGRFVTVKSPINEVTMANVRNAAVELNAQASREDRPAYLMLEITPGTSSLGNVTDLAKFLSSSDVGRVRTVAWIAEEVTGNNAIVALACDEIVMHPDAVLGDLGRGKAMPQADQEFVLSLTDRRRNARLSRGIVRAMMDPSVQLLQVDVESVDGRDEVRFLTADELRELRKTDTVVRDTVVIVDAGVPASFTGADAERWGVLTSKTVSDRKAVVGLYGLPLESMREHVTADGNVKVAVIAIHGVIDPWMESFVGRQLRTSVANGANLIIFDVDSPGGYLHTSENIANMIADLDPKKVTTVAWIKEEAISGAAIVSVACDRIFMTEFAKIGDAGPIEMREGQAFERADEKVLSDLRTFLRGLARRKNRPAALLEAMADKDLVIYEVRNGETGQLSIMTESELDDAAEEWQKVRAVPESRENNLLTLDGKRAHELALSEETITDIDELRLRLAIPTNVDLTPLKQTWVDTLIVLLNSGFGMFVLITLGIVCLYIELHVPSGLFGILAVVFFAMFFWSRFLGGTAGMLELILFVIGLGLMAAEIFIVPGFGVFGVSGILLMIASLVMASHTFGGLSSGEAFDRSMGSLGSIAGALIAVCVSAVVLNKFLPSIPFLNRMILTPPGQIIPDDPDAPQLSPDLMSSAPGGSKIPVRIGDRGRATSMLRPAGKATINEHFLDVVSDGPFLEHGTEIEVVRVQGNRVVVRQAAKAV